jgi:CheY-like chemotaxis protein
VADGGIGLAPEALPVVFEMFSQALVSPGRVQGGLGIGLALAKGLVELHGGTIEARSDGPGKGSEFIVVLPASDATAATAIPPPAPASLPRRVSEDGAGAGVAPRRRILVADDLRDNADVLAMVLRHKGHEVRVAYDGTGAIEVAAAWKPEVVLLDIGMPDIDGYEVCRFIRSLPGQVPFVVAQTGWGGAEDRRRAREAGFDHHLLKPVDPAALDAVLEVFARRTTGSESGIASAGGSAGESAGGSWSASGDAGGNGA